MPSNRRSERSDAHQPNAWKVSFFTALLTSIITIIGALGVAKWNDTLERSRRVEQERREAYANLRGAQRQLESLLAVQMNARIRLEYNEAQTGIIGDQHPRRELYIDEVKRLVQLEETLNTQTEQALREFYKYVAMVEILFTPSPELKKHIEYVYGFTGFRLQELDKSQKKGLTADNIDSWYKNQHDSARAIILQEFREPTKALLRYLASQIPSHL